ncbi:ACB domain-containing protein [Meloidogyne graminicola]|uniref:ACB domain-containing protein n=1 Tax=Meloidogyne graminicola TaxID=189291 RepID=A0A8S9ZYV0_9BILA|nr:ACB domain-containing protein [Meloidogyne graminicola]
MFSRCSILNFKSYFAVRIAHQSSKAALKRNKEVSIERQKRLLGNSKVSPRIVGQIRKWKKFLNIESFAIQNINDENSKRFEEEYPVLFLSVLRAWQEPPEGIFVEFLLRKLYNEDYLTAFSSSKQGPLNELSAIILDIQNENLKDHHLGPSTFPFNSNWTLNLAENDMFERLLDMFKGENLVNYPGYGLLLKSFKIGTVNRILRDKTKNLELKSEFDESQKNAIYGALNSKRNFVAIHGPPGTGKTKVIAEIVYQCLTRNERVVVCAPSNKAVDNALIACLRRGIDENNCTRLGLSKIDEKLSSTQFASMFRQHTFYESLQNYWERRKNVNESKIENLKMYDDIIARGFKLENFINRSVVKDIKAIFCTVTNGSLHWLFEQNLFRPDLIILDEAGHVNEPISWQILLLGHRFVLVGDHHQLDSIILSTQKDFKQNDNIPSSLLRRLMTDFENKKGYLYMLNVNYRSNELIQRWSNNHFYENKLIASNNVKEILLNDITKNNSINSIQLIDDPLVLLDTADLSKDELIELQLKYPNFTPITFFDTRPIISPSYYNLGEAICATHQILALQQSGLQPSEIGCITPYALQTKKIKKLLALNSDHSFDISSVDAFQGQQREAIVMSFVRNNNQKQIGFLKNLRRMNVAVTRAKRQFFLIASSKVLKRHQWLIKIFLDDFYEIIRKEGQKIKLINKYSSLSFYSNNIISKSSYSSNTSSLFDKAVSDLKNLPNDPDDVTKLELYGLFKQASIGDVSGEKPGILDFVGRAKFDSWSKNKGLTLEEAQRKYIEIVHKLVKNSNNSSNSEDILIKKQGKIFRIELNRPNKYNAITWEMYEELINALTNSNKCKETSITVLTGNGNYYCAGNDLSNFTRNIKTPSDFTKMADKGEEVLERFVRAHIEHEKPLISLVNGPAIGISVTLLALFDLVIASDKSSFHSPFSSLGQSPEGCSSYTFPLLMGTTKACEMLLFDKKISPAEAYERNLVTRVIPHNNFFEETERLISNISELPPDSLRVNKQLIRNVHKDKLLHVCKHECLILKQRWLSEECQKALQKFATRKTNEN